MYNTSIEPAWSPILNNLSKNLLRGHTQSLLLGNLWRPLQRHGHGVIRALSRRPVRSLRPTIQAQDGPYDCYAARKWLRYHLCGRFVIVSGHNIVTDIQISKLSRYTRVYTVVMVVVKAFFYFCECLFFISINIAMLSLATVTLYIGCSVVSLRCVREQCSWSKVST